MTMTLPLEAPQCDRCGARARVLAKLPTSETGLLFCQHHFNEHESKLKEMKAMILERTE